MPAIQPTVAQLTVFQRTPAWVIPRHDGTRSPHLQRLFAAVPLTERAVRGYYYLIRELMVPGLTRHPRMIRPLENIARKHLATQIPHPGLRRKLTPTFAMGCKRILISNDWYPTLGRDNVAVVTDTITKITEGAVVTADGTTHPTEVIIFGTGFQATEPPVSRRITGRGGQTLAATWNGSMRAHKCTTVPRFPNFFILNGPNLGVGHTSMIYMIESQIHYIVRALQKMTTENVATIEVSAATESRFVTRIRARDNHSVWTTGGCASWYLDADGHNTTMWPRSTLTFRRLTKNLDWGNYHTNPAPTPAHQPTPVATPTPPGNRYRV